MDKEKIIEILDDWNFWHKDLPVGLPRSAYLEKYEKLAKTGQVVAVMGVRRSGKSTLIKQYMKKKIDEGADQKNFLYVNFEEPRFAGELSLDFLQKLYDAYLEIVRPSGKPSIFLDEVQHVDGWERFARALHERGDAMLCISGSSSALLSKEFGASLTGRHVDLIVYPLGFAEFLSFKGMAFATRLELIANKTRVKQALREYLEHGGFPLVTLSGEKQEILSRYFEDIISRDVAQRHKIKKIERLKALAKYYLTNIGSRSSFRNIKNFMQLSLDSVERFSAYFQEAYFVFFVSKFSYSLKEQEVNNKKVYSIDPGLRNAVGFKITEDMGKLYENAAYLKLLPTKAEIYYYSGANECDFIVKKGRDIKGAIQVCFSLTSENREREIKGLLEAMKQFKLKEGKILTEDLEATEKHDGKTIRFVPLWKWLLEDEN